LHSSDAPLTPARSGDVFDQEFLGGSARIVFLKEAFDQFEELAGFLGFQNDVFRKETMTGTVAGGGDFSLKADGA
jgi:hypothetical protein